MTGAAFTAKILIIDNDEMNRYVLSRRLQYEGYQAVQTAESGQQGLERLRAEHFDLVFLDVVMPEMSGYQVLEIMAADAQLRLVPVIVISAGDDDSAIKCLELGAKGYLTKPFQAAKLKECLAACLDQREQGQQPVYG